MIITPNNAKRAWSACFDPENFRFQKMKAAVIRFPVSNCDQDCFTALNNVCGIETQYVWHKETSVEQFDLIVLPGGFSYGDYLRCGAIARFSPVMQSVIAEANKGKLVLGI